MKPAPWSEFRPVLVARARQRLARPLSGPLAHEPLPLSDEQCAFILRLDEAVTGLAAGGEPPAKDVEMRHFAGMTEEQIAATRGIEVRSVKRDLVLAKALLRGVAAP